MGGVALKKASIKFRLVRPTCRLSLSHSRRINRRIKKKPGIILHTGVHIFYKFVLRDFAYRVLACLHLFLVWIRYKLGSRLDPATSRYGSCVAAVPTCSLRRSNKHISEMSVNSIPRQYKCCSFVQRPRRDLLFDANWDGRMTERRNQLKAANLGPEVSSCALQLGDRISCHLYVSAERQYSWPLLWNASQASVN